MIQTRKRWAAARIEAYVVLVTALALNLPLLTLALAYHLEGVPAVSLAGIYAGLVIVGYYGLALLLLGGEADAQNLDTLDDITRLVTAKC